MPVPVPVFWSVPSPKALDAEIRLWSGALDLNGVNNKFLSV